jgi:S-adenosylmethionine/arginine decarboxylase-like enzyme
MNNAPNPYAAVLVAAIDFAGGMKAVAALCGVSHVAVHKWLKNGRLPRTEYTGETRYAELIARACKNKDPETAITRDQLLGMAAQRVA